MTFVHNIDPVLFEISGIYFWLYGVQFTAGFLGIFLWLRYRRKQLGISLLNVYEASVIIALAVLIFGRLVEVFFYEWAFYSQDLKLYFAYWIGGMSTHGVLLGGLVGMFVFCRLGNRNYLDFLDEMSIPAAFFMAIGRISNFIDGTIVGRPSTAWWAVQFPYTEGSRHPVVLYDCLKNFLMIPVLLMLRRSVPHTRGLLAGAFIFMYGFFRIFVDIFRQYPISVFHLGAGQILNLLMAVGGVLIIWALKTRKAPAHLNAEHKAEKEVKHLKLRIWALRILFILLLIFPLLIASDWTQNVVTMYAGRHDMSAASSIYSLVP